MKSMRRGAPFLQVKSNLTRFIHNDNDAKRRSCVSIAISPSTKRNKNERITKTHKHTQRKQRKLTEGNKFG